MRLVIVCVRTTISFRDCRWALERTSKTATERNWGRTEGAEKFKRCIRRRRSLATGLITGEVAILHQDRRLGHKQQGRRVHRVRRGDGAETEQVLSHERPERVPHPSPFAWRPTAGLAAGLSGQPAARENRSQLVSYIDAESCQARRCAVFEIEVENIPEAKIL